MARSKTYKFVGKYQDYLRFVDTVGTLDKDTTINKYSTPHYLKPIETEGILYLILDYLSDYDRYRLLEWEQADVDVKFLNDWHNFEVSVATDDERYANELDELARAIGIAILDVEEDLYMQYQEKFLNGKKGQTYRFVAKYKDHFKFFDMFGGPDYLRPMALGGVLHLMWDYLSYQDRCRLSEWKEVDLNIQISDKWRGFEVTVSTNDERYAEYLDELAHAIGMAILDLEKDLYREYEEGF